MDVLRRRYIGSPMRSSHAITEVASNIKGEYMALLASELGMFTLPSSLRQSPMADASQHSRWQVCAASVQAVSWVQLLVQPDIHFVSDPSIIFFNYR